MTRLDLFKQQCLEAAQGDVEKALHLACMEAVRWHQNTSPGFVRAAPTHSAPWQPKTPVEPVDGGDEWTKTGQSSTAD